MSYWYVGSPYTKYPGGLEEAFRIACAETARLMLEGFAVFCPIAHTHSVAHHGNIPKKDHDFWMRVDKPMVDAAVGMIILTMEGWQESEGLQQEVEWFRAAAKPVLFLEPGAGELSLTDLSLARIAPSTQPPKPSRRALHRREEQQRTV